MISGAKSVADPAALFPARVGDSLSEAEAGERFGLFREAYEKEAVLSCGFILEKRTGEGRGLSLTILVCEGPFVRLLELEGNAIVPADTLKSLLYSRQGGPFFQDSLTRDIARIREFYEQRNITARVLAEVMGGREKRIKISVGEDPRGMAVGFRGVRAFSREQALELCGVPRGGVGDISLLRLRGLEALKKAYRERGYFNCAISSRVEEGLCVVEVAEGKRAVISRVLFTGNTRFPAESLLYHADFRMNEPYSRARAEGLARAMVEFYEGRGFPFCVVRLKPPGCGAESLEVALVVTENGRFTLGRFTAHGNATTREAVVAKLARFREGEVFSQPELERMRERLARCGLFDRAEPLALTTRENRRILDVHAVVSEALYNNIEGVVGYNPEAGEGALSGYFNLGLDNIAGTNRKVALNYLKENPVTEGALRYSEPWLLDTRVGGELFLNFRIEEPDYALWEAEGRINVPLNDAMTFYTGLSRGVLTYRAADATPVTLDVLSSHAGVRIDRRDFPMNPRAGWMADVPVYYRYKKEEGRDFDEVRFALNGEGYFPLRGPHVIALEGAWRGLATGDDSLVKSELFPLGGASTVRGYREGRLRGQSVLFCRSEYRFLAGRRSRLLLFLDAGAADSALLFSNVRFPDDILLGYGAGFMLESRRGLAGVFVGLAKGETPADAKIHLRLRNNF